MAYIDVPEKVPGIRSLVMFRPDTGEHLYNLAQVLLRGPGGLSDAERELLAAFVSSRNECRFCTNSHAAAARVLYGDNSACVNAALTDIDNAHVSEKMKQLLQIAGKIQHSGKDVTEDDISKAREAGATDTDIHDAVLIAATFSLFNRYVDGLASFTPADENEYAAMGVRMAAKGYVLPKPI